MSHEQVPPGVTAVGSSRAPHRLLGTLAVLSLLQLPWPRWLFPGDGLLAQALREFVFWLMAALLLAYILLRERRPLRSIGLAKPRWNSIAWGVGGAAVTVTGLAFIYLFVLPALGRPAAEQQIDEVKALPPWFFILAAVFEELFYRGFAIERVTELSRRRWLAALVSLALFTFAHLDYWGWTHLIVAGYGGLVLTALYLLRRDLVTNMLAHWLTDVVGFLLA
jgi:membrane protease YdiL (CAAX protease family)